MATELFDINLIPRLTFIASPDMTGIKPMSISELLSQTTEHPKKVLKGKVVKPKPKNESTQQTTPKNESGSEYTIHKGDSWWKLAQKHLGDSRRWKELMEFNGYKQGQTIHPGMKIRVPGDDQPSEKELQDLRRAESRYAELLKQGKEPPYDDIDEEPVQDNKTDTVPVTIKEVTEPDSLPGTTMREVVITAPAPKALSPKQELKQNLSESINTIKRIAEAYKTQNRINIELINKAARIYKTKNSQHNSSSQISKKNKVGRRNPNLPTMPEFQRSYVGGNSSHVSGGSNPMFSRDSRKLIHALNLVFQVANNRTIPSELGFLYIDNLEHPLR